MSSLIDTHAHLHDRAFNSDRADMLARAREAGLDAIVTVGTDRTESEAAIAVARTEPDVFATVGLHPHDAKDWDDALRTRYAALASDPKVVAIGEIGLDYYRNLSPRPAQERAFREQLELANELRLPVVVHARDADGETAAILDEWALSATCGHPIGVLHCYAGDVALAYRYTELGFLISIAGPVTYPKSERIRAVATTVSVESLVVETDAPYLTPQPWRGQRNESAYVVETARYIAELRGDDDDELAKQCGENARRLFRLPAAQSLTQSVKGAPA